MSRYNIYVGITVLAVVALVVAGTWLIVWDDRQREQRRAAKCDEIAKLAGASQHLVGNYGDCFMVLNGQLKKYE